MTRLAREANMKSERPEGMDKAMETEKKVEDQKDSNFDIKVSDKRVRRISPRGCDIIVECEDKRTSNGRSSFQSEPGRSRTVSFTLPKSNLLLEERHRRSSIQQKRTNVMVTSGGLIFLLIAAALVTASFLMSPVIETILSKYSLLYYVSGCVDYIQ
jgi:hypothetical protein